MMRYRGLIFYVTGFLCAVSVGGCTMPVKTAAEITECDVLVSHPSDPDRVSAGVASSAVFHDRGIAACTSAVANDPDNPRLNYQLARVLFYDGRTDAALPHLEKAASKGYRQAQFVLGYILDGGVNGVQRDACRAEELWLMSARSGRLAALVSYPRHVIRGRFADCPPQAQPEELGKFLAEASTRDLDYYQKLLVDDLLREHKRWLVSE